MINNAGQKGIKEPLLISRDAFRAPCGKYRRKSSVAAERERESAPDPLVPPGFHVICRAARTERNRILSRADDDDDDDFFSRCSFPVRPRSDKSVLPRLCMRSESSLRIGTKANPANRRGPEFHGDSLLRALSVRFNV